MKNVMEEFKNNFCFGFAFDNVSELLQFLQK